MKSRTAARSGGELVGCFKSEKMISVGASTVPRPFELATAIDLPGSYTSADLEQWRARDIEKWKGFELLSRESENYTALLNDLIKRTGPVYFLKFLSSYKPVLVSIGQLDAKSFSVVAIRSYVSDSVLGVRRLIPATRLAFATSRWINNLSQQVILTMVDGSAWVLRGSRVVRLDIQRALADPSDVDQVQNDIAEWVRAVSSTPTG
jgi:hypothetical protein